MKRPNSKRNLDMTIRRLGGGEGTYLRNRTIIANAVVAQMLSEAAQGLDVLQSVSEAVHWANRFIGEIANF